MGRVTSGMGQIYADGCTVMHVRSRQKTSSDSDALRGNHSGLVSVMDIGIFPYNETTSSKENHRKMDHDI